MKGFKFVLIALLAMLTAAFFASCKNDDGGGNDNNGNDGKEYETVDAGWYAYITTIGTYSQTAYYYVNAGGKIERAGGENYEYTGTELETIKSTQNYATCKKNADSSGFIAFKKCAAPGWADDGGQDKYFTPETKYVTVKVGDKTYLNELVSDYSGDFFKEEGNDLYKRKGSGASEYLEWTADGTVTLKVFGTNRVQISDGNYAFYHEIYVFTVKQSSGNPTTVDAGWYAYNITSSSTGTVYLYLDSSGNVVRAGSTAEYSGELLEAMKAYTYSKCTQDAAQYSNITFNECAAPKWA